jgi:hypothetical protein
MLLDDDIIFFGFDTTLYRRAVNQLIKYIERGPNYKSDEGDMKTVFAEQYISSISNWDCGIDSFRDYAASTFSK